MTKFKPLAIIFDMDGVLVDSETWWCKFEDEFYLQIMPNWNKDDHHLIIGQSIKGVYETLSNKYELKSSWEQFRDKYHEHAGEIYQKQASLMPGVLETLKHFKKNNLPMALASSSFHSWIEMVVTRFDIKKYFKIIISSEDVGSRGKPAPDIYLYTADKLGVDPAQCLVIEDSTNGVLSAKAAGMTVVGFKPANEPEQDVSRADYVITKLSDLLELWQS